MKHDGSGVEAPRGTLLGRLRAARLDEVAASVAALACLLAASGGAAWTTLALALLTAVAAALVLIVALSVPRGPAAALGRFPVGRALLAAALLGLDAPAAAALLALALFAESACARILRAQAPLASRLPGCRIAEPRRISGAAAAPVWIGALVVVAWLSWWSAPWWLGAFVAAASLVITSFSAARGILRIRSRRDDASRLGESVLRLAPEFVVHWDALPGTAFQMRMWMPYLEALGRPFLVVARNPDSYPEAVSSTTGPVVYRPEIEDLDGVVVPSMRAAFYVNNATRNVQFIRYAELTHVQLNHGESDKAPSFSPSLRAYDLNFVAGRAAIDRFAAHDVPTHEGFFRIVGRPQTADIATSTRDDEVRVVLYAPTWAGFHADSAYSSLAFGELVVEALIARGLTVIFRPHPHTDMSPVLRDQAVRVRAMLRADGATSGRRHLVGPAAETELTLVECFNASDALVADVSSVAADYLASGKPFAISQVLSDAAPGPDGLVSGGYPFDASAGSIAGAVDEMLRDPRREQRLERRAHVLGPPAAEAVAAFVAAATEAIQPRRA